MHLAEAGTARGLLTKRRRQDLPAIAPRYPKHVLAALEAWSEIACERAASPGTGRDANRRDCRLLAARTPGAQTSVSR